MEGASKYKVALLILLGLILRILYAFAMQEVLLTGDAAYYIQHAVDIVSGKNFEPEWPPGLSFYLAGSIFIFGQELFAYVLAMLFLFLLFSLFLYKSLQVFFPEKWSIWGLAFFTLNPTFIHHSVVPLTQLPIALCILALFYFLVKKAPGWKSGLCLALAILTRAGSLTLLPISLGYLMYQKRYKALPGFLAIMFLLLASWQYKSYQMTDRWIWINDFNSYNFYVGNNAYTPDYKTWWLGSHIARANPDLEGYYAVLDSVKSLPKAEQAGAYNSLAWTYIEHAPTTFVYRFFNRFRTFLAFDTYTGATIISKNKIGGILCLLLDGGMFILLGLAFWLGLERTSQSLSLEIRLLLLLFMIAYMLPYLLAFSHPTYHLPVSPFLSFFALAGISATEAKPVWKPHSWFIRLAILFFLFIQIEWVWQMADRLGGI